MTFDNESEIETGIFLCSLLSILSERMG